MRGARRRQGRAGAALAAGSTAGAFALAQPPLGLWPLALVCLAPLLRGLAGRGPLARARLGALAGGLAALAIAVGPAAVGAAEFSSRPLWQGWLLAGAIGPFFGIAGFATFALLAGDPLRGRLPAALARAGCAFAVAELVRSELFGGLPWLLLAHALAPAPALLALAAWGGVPLVSAWLGALAAACARLVAGPRGPGLATSFAVLAVAGGVPAMVAPGAGGVRVAAGEAAPAGWFRVALVQPALRMETWADPLRARETVARLTELTRRALERTRADLVVWPENAVQALLPANRALVADARAALGSRTAHLLLGAPRHDARQPGRRFNAALLYAAGPDPVAVHDKVELLPIFERVPAWLRAATGWDAGLTPGAAPAVLQAGELRIGALICYELLFAHVARTQVRDGAGVLVNLSNDAWFGGSGGAEQHFAAAPLLAVTLRRPLLRSTPTGITAALDAAGRVVARLEPGAPGVLLLDLAPADGLSPAARLGRLPAWVAVGVSVGFAAPGAARRVRDIARGA